MLYMSGLSWFGRGMEEGEMQCANPHQSWQVHALGGLKDKHLATSCLWATSLPAASVHRPTPRVQPISNSKILVKSSSHFIQEHSVCVSKNISLQTTYNTKNLSLHFPSYLFLDRCFLIRECPTMGASLWTLGSWGVSKVVSRGMEKKQSAPSDLMAMYVCTGDSWMEKWCNNSVQW